MEFKQLTRRNFLKLSGVSALIPFIPKRLLFRKSYVNKGEIVDYIGCPASCAFIGGRIVESVGRWNGSYYPVVLLTNGYPPRKEAFRDLDLSNFRREVPNGFWHVSRNRKLYNNVHSYVREKRFS